MASLSDPDIPAVARKQLRMALRMAVEHADELRYVHDVGWHIWERGRWALDEKEESMRCVVETKINAMREMADLTDPVERGQLFDDARGLDSNAGLRGTLSIAAALTPFSVGVSELDQDPVLFNTPDGVYNLETRSMQPHGRRELHTKMTNASYLGGRGDGPFARFLQQVLPNPEVRQYAQKIMGYAAFGAVRDQVFPLVTGQSGTGKSTWLNIMQTAFGSYADTAPRSLLMATGGNQHPTEIAALRGQRLVVVHETEQGQPLKVEAMKNMTGGDKLKGRFMRQDFFEFTPSHTFMLVTNYPPMLDADDDAAWDRIKVIPFDQKFRGTSSENVNLGAEIIAEDLPSAILWVVNGYSMYRAEGLHEPEAVRVATRAQADKSDMFSQFLAEQTERTEDEQKAPRLTDLYTLWNGWADAQRIKPGRKNDIATRLTKRGYVVTDGRERQVLGLSLVSSYGWS